MQSVGTCGYDGNTVPYQSARRQPFALASRAVQNHRSPYCGLIYGLPVVPVARHVEDFPAGDQMMLPLMLQPLLCTLQPRGTWR